MRAMQKRSLLRSEFIAVVGVTDRAAVKNKGQRGQDHDHASDADGKACSKMFRKKTDLKITDGHKAHENHHVEAHYPSPIAVINRALNGSTEG